MGRLERSIANQTNIGSISKGTLDEVEHIIMGLSVRRDPILAKLIWIELLYTIDDYTRGLIIYFIWRRRKFLQYEFCKFQNVSFNFFQTVFKPGQLAL